jgi:hypothetical protein
VRRRGFCEATTEAVKQRVARSVAEGVVVLLKAVEIEHHQQPLV